MSSFRIPERLPTHAQLIEFFSTILPPHSQDVPLQYHTPRWAGYDPNTSPVRDVVLSITPTTGVYDKLNQLARGCQKAVCFLHRPFRMDRRALPRGSLVLANHKRFDELLTTGYNTALAVRLDMAVDRAGCIQGYKGDPDRRIGIVAPLLHSQTLSTLQNTIQVEVGAADAHESAGGSGQIVQAIAIMNAFGPDEVGRAVSAAREAGILQQGDASGLLYLTGQPRELGLREAKNLNMPVVCVGHQSCEEWGVRYLAYLLQQTWTELGVHTIFEDEIPSVKAPSMKEALNTSVIHDMNATSQAVGA
ncbi:hypothetical protein BKA67DRAFT_541514 [Truncatella angustata]|uniref:Uncharacterized protein n=1 Tax=Truncatella angustata TaxID=152316 RepID=A0A9P8RLD8_9PEZI|nr:uncharacterized protein BKA67DRAFT_541514 [Truncatella angustata]KAH6645281.1 hypothetical protein BKA67DRAFT_541514 [Truncatella angustata]KAH8203338.1 hypothetical protein TruAng_002534 [Truncatella angustata]